MYLKKLCTLALLLSQIHIVNATTIESGNMTKYPRYLYQLINGTSESSYAGGYGGPTDSSGKPSGFIGMIRELTGPTALGFGLSSCGYKICSQVPTTGSCTHTEGSDSFVMTFATPTKTIPTGHTGANGTKKYDRKVQVAYNGTDFMDIEFSCTDNIGWVRFADNGGISGGSTANARNMEIYYDTETNTSTKLDLSMYYNQSGGDREYFQAKFATEASNKFNLYVTRASKASGTDSGFRVAIRGDYTTKKATVFMAYENGSYTNTATTHTDNDNIATASGGDIMCLSYSDSDNPTATNGSCTDLAISAPGSLIINSGGDMSINSTASDIQAAMTSL